MSKKSISTMFFSTVVSKLLLKATENHRSGALDSSIRERWVGQLIHWWVSVTVQAEVIADI